MTFVDNNINEHGNSATQLRGRNYRHQVVEYIPAGVLGYQMIIWPLINPQIGRLPEIFTSLNLAYYPILAAIAFSVWILEKPKLPTGTVAPSCFLGVFWLYSVTSSLWADDPANSFSETLPNTILFLALFFSCASAQSFTNVFRPIFFVVVATIAFNAFFVVMMPPGPIGHEGAYYHKNEFGAAAALCILTAMSQLRSRRLGMKILAILTVCVGLLELDASDSKTSLGFTFIAPLIAFGIVFIQKYFRIAALVQFVVYVCIVFFAFWLGKNVFDFSVTDLSMIVSGEPTFTGRVGLWEFAIDQIKERPIWGHGYNSFWQIGLNSASHDAAPGFVKVATAGHNTYIDLLLHGGVVGCGLLVLGILAAWRQISHVLERDTQIGFFLTNVMLFLILQSLLEAVWFTPSGPMGAFVAIIAFFPMADKVAKI